MTTVSKKTDRETKEGPIGEQTLPFLSKIRSAPNTPRGAVEGEMSKEMQIAFLREKLEFTEKQLEDKDLQLEHYKQLVKTLKDVLAEVSGRRPTSASPALPSPSAKTPPPPPPGFEGKPQKYALKGRKVRSFHNDHYTPLDLDEDESFPGMRTDGDKTASWRKPIEEPTPPPPLPPSSTSEVPKKTSKLPKSVSHSAISSLSEDSKESRSALRSSAPLKRTSGGNGGLEKGKTGSLKKSQSMTSVYTVLEENRLDLKFPELDQMTGQIYALSKYQQGCRFLQKKLDEKNEEHTSMILNELADHLGELMIDPFGNYLFSKLMEVCSTSQRQLVIDRIVPDLMPTAFDMYGTQSLQKMIPFLSEAQTLSLISVLKENAIMLIKHNKANYLVQYFLDHLSPTLSQWIYDAVSQSIEEVSKDRVGCVIVKRCIDHATPEQKTQLAKEVTAHALQLVSDPFGNYVVQHILDKASESHAHQLIRQMLGNLKDLCMGKFSSNVIEKCLQMAPPDVRSEMLKEITETKELPTLLNDRFANFVIQTALDVANPEERQELVKNILPHLGRHYSPYTKRLQKKILQV